MTSNNGDECYSNRYESPALQIQAWENCDLVDEVFESGARKAIGTVTGTDSSSSIEKYQSHPIFESSVPNEVKAHFRGKCLFSRA